MWSWPRAMALPWPSGSVSSGHFYILAGCRLVPPGRALRAVQRRLHAQGRGPDVAGGRLCALRGGFHVLGGHLEDAGKPLPRGDLGGLHLPGR